MKGVTWIALGIGGAGSIAGTGLAINHIYGGTSIKEYIEINKKSKNKVFLTSLTPSLNEIREKYKTSTRTKPQKNGSDVPETELGKWCEDAVKEKFSNEDSDIYEQIISWCYINVNSFAEQLKNNENKKVSTQTSGHQDWTGAWNKYSQGRSDESLKIIYSVKQSILDGADSTSGATALKEWCNLKVNIKLYEDDAEKEYRKFDHWCPKVDAVD